MRKIIEYLHLNRVGALELLFAMYCILSGYSWGPIKGHLIFILLMAVIAYFRKDKNLFSLKELTWVTTFVAVHELILMLAISAPGYMFNNTLSTVIVCISIYPIARSLNYEKMVGALNWIALLSIGGIIYHFLIIRSGGYVTPISLPFMPSLDTTSRFFEEGFRPTSFYAEPAAFVTYMMIPLFIALCERKYIWMVFILFSMFLSTSTTGISMSILMLIVFALTQNIGYKYKSLVVIMGLSFVYVLLNGEIFSAGLEKINETDIETTSRVANGPAMVFNMPIRDIITGMPAANPYDYYNSGGFHSSQIIVKEESIFCSTFWLVLAKFGVFGLFLYLSMFVRNILKSRDIIPYIVMLFASMFFQGIAIGSSGFAYQIIFIYVFVNRMLVKKL